MSATAEQNAPPAPPSAGFVGRIPVRNLWLLMLYASNLYKELGTKKSAVEDCPDDLPDLIAEILVHAVESRLRRQLSHGYREREAIINRVRGRINILATERHQLLARGKVACRFEELTIDTPRNRFVRGALASISRIVSSKRLQHRCLALANSLKGMGVSETVPTRTQLSAERFGRNDRDDQFMITAAKLAFDLALPTEDAGNNHLPAPAREEGWVRGLYERAIGGFYDVTLSPHGWQVRTSTTLQWPITDATPGIAEIFPTMRTDITLTHTATNRRIIIDTKFTSILTSGQYRTDSLRSGYIYQIYAYLQSQSGRNDPLADHAAGLLLHPSIGTDIHEHATIQNHTIHFATIDLTAPPTEIRRQLLLVIAAIQSTPVH